VTPEKLEQIARYFWSMVDLLNNVQYGVNRAGGYLDSGGLEGNARARLENRLIHASNQAKKLESQTRELAHELELIAQRFSTADGQTLLSAAGPERQRICRINWDDRLGGGNWTGN
jgi:hypothetical protein